MHVLANPFGTEQRLWDQLLSDQIGPGQKGPLLPQSGRPIWAGAQIPGQLQLAIWRSLFLAIGLIASVSFSLNLLVDFLAVDSDLSGCLCANTYLVAIHVQDSDCDVVADSYGLARATREDQHECMLPDLLPAAPTTNRYIL